MTSPDHYRLAEQLADEAYNEFRHDDEAGATALAAMAQVHATLALAAAAEAALGRPAKATRPLSAKPKAESGPKKGVPTRNEGRSVPAPARGTT
jgi:hypothetical protein